MNHESCTVINFKQKTNFKQIRLEEVEEEY